MMAATLHATPRLLAVLREQIRTVALAVRWPVLVAAALLVLATVLIIVQRRGLAGAIDFHPELSMLPGMAGLLFPLAIWAGEERFGSGFFWTLPVDRRQHVLLKVCAGWLCLLGVVGAFVLWHAGLTLATGGNFLGSEAIRLLPSATVPPPGVLDPALLRTVQWTPWPLFWLVPFTAATGGYLLASAVAVGVRHPLWWIAGLIAGFVVLDAVRAATDAQWLTDVPRRALGSLFYGPYGLDTLLTARSESLSSVVTLSTGETVGAWRGLPHAGQWAVATLLWIGAGLAALWAAATRHRERR